MKQITVFEEGDKVRYCGKHPIEVTVLNDAIVSSHRSSQVVSENRVSVGIKLTIETGKQGVVAKGDSSISAGKGSAVPVDFAVNVGVAYVISAHMNPKYLEFVKEEVTQP